MNLKVEILRLGIWDKINLTIELPGFTSNWPQIIPRTVAHLIISGVYRCCISDSANVYFQWIDCTLFPLTTFRHVMVEKNIHVKMKYPLNFQHIFRLSGTKVYDLLSEGFLTSRWLTGMRTQIFGSLSCCMMKWKVCIGRLLHDFQLIYLHIYIYIILTGRYELTV